MQKFKNMTEITHKVISLEYTLFRDNEQGEQVESSVGREPLVFLSGVGQMIPDFENNVKNLNVGDSFSFGIVSDNAYGPIDKDAIFDLPNETFIHEGKMIDDVQVGNTIGLQDQDGRPFPAKVLKMSETSVTVDLNHPLAGQNLHFSGKILDTRPATSEEIEHGHVHGQGGHQH